MGNASKLDRTKCPPEYRQVESKWSQMSHMSIDGSCSTVADAWTHRDRIVADTIARLADALRKRGESLASSPSCFEEAAMADWMRGLADDLENGKVDLG